MKMRGDEVTATMLGSLAMFLQPQFEEDVRSAAAMMRLLVVTCRHPGRGRPSLIGRMSAELELVTRAAREPGHAGAVHATSPQSVLMHLRRAWGEEPDPEASGWRPARRLAGGDGDELGEWIGYLASDLYRLLLASAGPRGELQDC
jgi:hypothetical protein